MIKFMVTVPNSSISETALKSAVKKIGRNLAKRVHQTYDDLVSDWKDDGGRDGLDSKPEFVEKITQTSNKMVVSVKTDSLKYKYVDLGTDPHPIDPRPENTSGLLVFPSGEYTPRTRVGSLQTRSGGKDWNSPMVFTGHVERHPGNEARNFEKPINEEQIPLVIEDAKKELGKQIKIETESYGF